jgi:ATP-dependent Clp protease ATP-binding subunit ClpB
MDLEKYTDCAKALLQSAQSLALRRGHQRLLPEHLLKVLLDDKEGMCADLIAAAGGDPKRAVAGVEAGLAKWPKVEGSGAGQVYLSPELARVAEQAEQIASKAGDSSVIAGWLLALARATLAT